jgi:ribulose-phosphate 3-epimerase
MASTRSERLARLRDRRPRICPSLLDCDFGRLADEISDAARCGADVVHWDVMDGRFCPNFTYGPVLVRSLRGQTDLLFDVHLMMEKPDRYLDDFLSAGADVVSIHLEAVDRPTPLLRKIREAGALAGLAINPPTDVRAILPWLDDVDVVLVMSVMPGFGGQKFDLGALSKVKFIKELGRNVWVEIDGGINPGTIGSAVQAGASLFVVGSAFYNADNRIEVFGELVRQLV